MCCVPKLLAVNFSTGLAAVLLGAAAIIFIVLVVEAICTTRQSYSKNKKSKSAKAVRDTAEKESGGAIKPVELIDSEAVQPPEDTPLREEETLPAKPAAEDFTPLPEREEKADGEKEQPTANPQKAEPKKRKKKRVERLPKYNENGERITYDYSFTARLIQTCSVDKRRYSALKNSLLGYGFESRVCHRYESFYAGKKLGAKIRISEGEPDVYYALEPARFPDGTQDMSDKKSYAKTPLGCRVENGEQMKLSRRLIAALAKNFSLKKRACERRNFAAELKYEITESLIEKGLVKVKVRRKKSPRISEQISEQTEQNPPVKNVVLKPEKTSIKRPVKRCRKTVNLDLLFSAFREGETASCEEIKNRIFNGDENVTFIKILGRGKADKNITVIANSFSRSAEKYIIAAGGKVIKKSF